MKKITTLLSIPFLFLLGLITFAQAAEITMSLTPSVGTFQVGQEFNMTINLDTGSQKIVAADARIRFDSAKLEVKSVTEGEISATYVKNVNNQTGVITINIFSFDGFSWSGAMASVTFNAKSAGSAVVELVFDPTDTTDDSSVAVMGEATDQLSSVSSASYTLTAGEGPTATPAPTSTLVPTATSTPVPQQPTAVPTATKIPTPTATVTPTPSPTSTPTPTSALGTVGELPDTGLVGWTYSLLLVGVGLLLIGGSLVLR